MKFEQNSLDDSEEELVFPISDNESDALINENKQVNSISTGPADFTDIVGDKGKWQLKLFFLTMYCNLTTAFNHLSMSFLAYPVDHWCAPSKDVNLSLNVWQSEFLPNVTIKGLSQHSQCEEYIVDNYTFEVNILQTKSCDVWEYSSEFINSIVEEWNVICEKEWLLSTSQSFYMLGFLCAAFLSGQMSDMYGRYRTILISAAIALISGIAVAFSNSFIMFSIFRFFVALGQSGLNLVTYILFIEVIGSQYRAKYAVLTGIGWHVGYILLPLIAWLLSDWFSLQLAITLPCLFFISFYWIVPESPRWLLSNGRVEDAIPILKEAAAVNKIEVENIEMKAKTLGSFERNKIDSKANVLDLLRTSNLRKKTLCLYFIWAVIAFTYYGLSLNTNDLEGNAFVNFAISGVIEIPATIFCLFTMDRFGRKKPFVFTLLIGGVACFGCIFVANSYRLVNTGLSMVGKMCVAASFHIVYIYSSEIFPTVARNVGVGSCSTIARIGSSLAPFMKDLSKVTNPSVPLVMFGVLSIISAGLLMLLPETSNCLIPETLEQAENFDNEIKNTESGEYFKMTLLPSSLNNK